MRRGALALVGLAAFVVFLAAMLPASILVERLPRVQALQLSEVQGTMWHGTARARIAVGGGALEMDSVAWRFLPGRLLAGRIAFAVQASGRGVQANGELARGLAAWEARDVQASGEPALLALAAPILGTWRPQGALALAAPALSWDGRELRGSARGEWRGATLSVPDPQPLGSYVVELRGDGGPARVTLSTREGALRVAGNGTFTPPAQLALRGEARADGPAAAALAPLLDQLGPRRPDGASTFDWQVR